MFNILVKIVIGLGLIYVIVEVERVMMLWMKGALRITVDTEMVVCTSMALALVFYFLRSSDEDLKRKISEKVLEIVEARERDRATTAENRTREILTEEADSEAKLRARVKADWNDIAMFTNTWKPEELEIQRNERRLREFSQVTQAYGTFLNFKGPTDLLTACTCEAGLEVWGSFSTERYGDKYRWFVGLPNTAEVDYSDFLGCWADFLEALAEDEGIKLERDLEYAPLKNELYSMPFDNEKVDTSTFGLWKDVEGFSTLPAIYQPLGFHRAEIDEGEAKSVELQEDGKLEVVVEPSYAKRERRITRDVSALDLALSVTTPNSILIDTIARQLPLEELKEEILRRQGWDSIKRTYMTTLGTVLANRCTPEDFEEFLNNDEMGVVLKKRLKECQQ